MKFKKAVSAALVLSMCLGTACAQATTPTNTSESVPRVQAAFSYSEEADSNSETAANSTTGSNIDLTTDLAIAGGSKSVTSINSLLAPNSKAKPAADTKEQKGDYEWTPYVWSVTLTDAYGSSCKQTMFNFIDAVFNGADTFEYVETDDVFELMTAAYAVCPYMFKIVTKDIHIEDGKAKLNYRCSTEEAKQIIDDFAANCEEIINESVVKGDLPETKAMMIHYNFSKSLTYNYAADEADESSSSDINVPADINSYRAIVDREGVGEDFSMALAHLYLQCGLDVNIATGESEDDSHMWVYMILEGERVFIDPAWEVTHDGAGLSFFGINTSVYNDSGYYVDPFPLYEDEGFGAMITTEKYEPLWGMQKINSIERQDWEVVIDFINAEGENVTYIVAN